MAKNIRRRDEVPVEAAADDRGIPIGGESVLTEFVSEPAKDVAKVMTNQQTPTCPLCGSPVLQYLPHGTVGTYNARCAGCKHQFNASEPQRKSA